MSLWSLSAAILEGTYSQGGFSWLIDKLFLAPPAERQRSFSNTDSSVVRPSVRPGRGLSQKRFSNFSSFLA